MHEKYLALARDAGSAGDRIAAENYLQHAEHYFRIINMDTDGDSQGRGRNLANGGGGRFERSPDGSDGQEPTDDLRVAASDGPPVVAEAETAKANGAAEEAGPVAGESDHAEAAEPAPKRKVTRGNGKGRRPRAAPRAGASGDDGAAAGPNGANGDAPLAEE